MKNKNLHIYINLKELYLNQIFTLKEMAKEYRKVSE